MLMIMFRSGHPILLLSYLVFYMFSWFMIMPCHAMEWSDSDLDPDSWEEKENMGRFGNELYRAFELDR